MRTLIERAKAILDICAYELKGVSIGDLMTLEAAIVSELEMAQKDALRAYNKDGASLPSKRLRFRGFAHE